MTLGVPTLWLGPVPPRQQDRLAMCVDSVVALVMECQKIAAPFSLWNLPDQDFGETSVEDSDELRARLEGASGHSMSDSLFVSYLLTLASINAYCQIMDMDRPSVTDIKEVCAFFRQIVRIVEAGQAQWPEGIGDISAAYEEMENFLLVMASYPATSRMPPPEVTGFIKRNYVPTIAALQAILIDVGEKYLITETLPPCDCWECQVKAMIQNTERMVVQIGMMVDDLCQSLSGDDTAEDVRHPDDV